MTDILRYFPARISCMLSERNDICEWDEIRLRAGAPPVLRGRNGSAVLAGYICTADDIGSCFHALCDGSVHSFEKQIREGFITVAGGHRAGICGTAVNSGDRLMTLKNISGINFRIARQVSGCAGSLCRSLFSDGLCGVLVAGAPMSGKTTFLRDMCRYLSQRYRISVIDERSEIAAVYSGVPQNDVGPMCDVFDGFSKEEGIRAALRSMSPQMIVCDEIGGRKDIKALMSSVSCGVRIAASVHAGSPEELCGRKNIMRLVRTGIFEKIVFLGKSASDGKIMTLSEFSGNTWCGTDAC